MPPISFIVLNYNGANVLAPTLSALQKSLRKGDELIVLDNASPDASLALVRRKFPRVRILALKENKVLLGLNDAVRRARHPLVGLFNNDFILQKADWNALAKRFEDPSVFGVSAKTVHKDGKTLDFGPVRASSVFGFFRLDIVHRGTPASREELQQSVPIFSSPVAGLYDRKKFLQLGGFDELFYPAYWEEIDLAYRALKRGWRTCYDPGLVVLHNQEERVLKTFGRQMALRTSLRNKHLFIWKNFSSPRLLVPYVVTLPLVLLLGTLQNGLVYLSGFFEALPRLPRALARKRADERTRVLSDAQIFRLTQSRLVP